MPKTTISCEQALAPNTLDDPYALTEEVIRNCPPLFFHKPQNERLGTEGIWVSHSLRRNR